MKTLTSLMVLMTVIAVRADDLIEPATSELKLRSQANVCGGTVTLADVLNFAQADPRLREEIGGQPVLSGARPVVAATALEVSHEQIVKRLQELGVNLSRVLVNGALVCRVTCEPPETKPASTGEFRQVADIQPAPADAARLADARHPLVKTPAPAASGPKNEDHTLAGALRDHVNREVASLGGTAEVEFERAGQEFLELTTPTWEFSIRGTGNPTEKLGLREFRVTIRRDGRLERTAQIAARVRLVKNVLVARKPLSIGAAVKADEVALEPRIFDQTKDLGVDRVEPMIGQHVKKFIAVGEMVRARDLKPVDIVQRSKPVTILNTDSTVRMRLTGIALDSGSYGDTVRVRIGDSLKDRRELRAVVTGQGTVRIAEGEK